MTHRPILALVLAGCGASAPMSMDFEEAPPPPASMPAAVEQMADEEFAPEPEATAGFGAKLGRADGAEEAKRVAAKPAARARKEAENAAAARDEADGVAAGGEGEAEGETRTREWFPEAFLWQPLVETGDDGVASLDVRVPDQLTTWRVLALAHEREGHQAGAVHTFDSTLPVYVDPVVPGWLYAGDRLVLPVQAVNNTDRPLAVELLVDAEGATRGLGRATMSLTAGSSDVRSIPLDVVGAGEAKISAKLRAGADSDAAVRTIPVVPAGRPVQRVRGGTLAGRRELVIAGPDGADPTTEELEIRVFPGPLSVLQAELERLRGGARPEDGAYGYALASRLVGLSVRTGVEVDEGAVRRLRILAWQRVVREARAPDAGLAADLLSSLRDVEGDEQVQGLRNRLIEATASGQRADGTWSRRSRSTLQAVLVETAWAGRALPADRTRERLRAASAIERNFSSIEDPYTAAVVLASGLADGDRAPELLELVRGALGSDAVTGEPEVRMPGEVVDPWGVAPTRAEMLAWVVLALPADDPARGDLAAQLMSGWDARYGFGAGRADGVALEAVAEALGGVTGPVEIALEVGGQRVASGRLDPTQPKVPVLLSARPRGADAPVVLVASPEVPGLAFVATRRSWVPWSDRDRLPGVEVQASTSPLRVGQEGALKLVASAPSGTSLVIEQGLPAGATIDEVVARSRVQAAGGRLEVFSDRVRIVTRAFGAGEVMELSLPVTPSFAGRYQTVPLTISAGRGSPVPTRPVVWDVAGPGGA